jgi:hypothetical protein
MAKKPAKKSTSKIKKQSNFTTPSLTPEQIDPDIDSTELYFVMTTEKSGLYRIEGPLEDDENTDESETYNREFFIVHDSDLDPNFDGYDIEYIDGKWDAGSEISPPYGDVLVLDKKHSSAKFLE